MSNKTELIKDLVELIDKSGSLDLVLEVRDFSLGIGSTYTQDIIYLKHLNLEENLTKVVRKFGGNSGSKNELIKNLIDLCDEKGLRYSYCWESISVDFPDNLTIICTDEDKAEEYLLSAIEEIKEL